MVCCHVAEGCVASLGGLDSQDLLLHECLQNLLDVLVSRLFRVGGRSRINACVSVEYFYNLFKCSYCSHHSCASNLSEISSDISDDVFA